MLYLNINIKKPCDKSRVCDILKDSPSKISLIKNNKRKCLFSKRRYLKDVKTAVCGSNWALDPGDSWERLNMDGLLHGVMEYLLVFSDVIMS